MTSTSTTVDACGLGSAPIPETDSYSIALTASGVDPDGVGIEFIPRTLVASGLVAKGLIPD